MRALVCVHVCVRMCVRLCACVRVYVCTSDAYHQLYHMSPLLIFVIWIISRCVQSYYMHRKQHVKIFYTPVLTQYMHTHV